MTIQDQTQAGSTVPWSRFLSKRLQFAMDLLVLLGSFLFAYLLRFEFTSPPHMLHPMMVQLPCVVLLQFAALHLAGVHSFVWRYVGISEVRPFFVAAVSVFVVLVLIRFGLPAPIINWRVPLSICVMDTM